MNNFSKMDGITMLELTERGFHLDGNKMYFAMGSIANYSKATIYAPVERDSLLGEKVFCCFIEVEKFSESGHFEVDCDYKVSRYVALNNLIEYLEGQGFKNLKVEREKWEARKKLYREKWGE